MGKKKGGKKKGGKKGGGDYDGTGEFPVTDKHDLQKYRMDSGVSAFRRLAPLYYLWGLLLLSEDRQLRPGQIQGICK